MQKYGSTLNLVKSGESSFEVITFNKEKWRNYFLKMLFLVIVGLALIYASIGSYLSSNSQMLAHLNAGDQLLLPVSTYFSKGVHFDTVNSSLYKNVLLRVLPTVPNISSVVSHSLFGSSFQIASWTYQFWGLNLLKGTTVKISVCADLNLQFYLLFGERKMTQWRQVILFTDYDYHANIRASQHCSSKNNYITVTLKANRSDIYFLLFSSTVGWRFFTQVFIILEFNRTYYDVSQTKYMCFISDKGCYANLAYGSSEISLLEAIPSVNSSVNIFQKYTIVYTPEGQMTFYLKFYSSVYFAIVFLTLIYVVGGYFIDVCGKKRFPPLLENNQNQSILSQTSRLHENISSDGGSIMLDTTDHGLQSLREGTHSFNESNNDFFNNKSQYSGEQRMMDSCLTSAGVSAI